VDAALGAAAEIRLWCDFEWLALGHYRPARYGWRSAIDDPGFFIAEYGRISPEAEMIAVIKVIYGESPTNYTSRYIARVDWLRQRLALAGVDIPSVDHSEFDRRFPADEMPTKIILAFPGPSADGVSSAFGHLFLIFARDDKSRLLAPTVSYAALVNPSSALLYPFRGLCGGYKSYFTMRSHADRLKEYSAIETRDVWEYELDLEPHEVTRLFRHTWELQNIYSHYYFLTRNCAYGILRLLDVARPGIFPASFDQKRFVLPIDVLNHIQKIALVKSVRFVPSLLTEMRALAEPLSWRHKRLARRIAHGMVSPVIALSSIADPANRADVLNVALRLAKLRIFAGHSTVDAHKLIMSDLIEAAAQAPVDAASGGYPSNPMAPQRAHATSRVKAGAVLRNDKQFGIFGVRPAYHDASDPLDGILFGMHLQMLNSEVLINDMGSVSSWRLCVFESRVLKDADMLYRPMSYHFSANFAFGDEVDFFPAWNAFVKGGFGYTVAPLASIRLFSMVDAEFHSRTGANDLWGGCGPSMGVVTDYSHGIGGFCEIRYLWSIEDHDRWGGRIGISAALTDQTGFACQYSSETFAGNRDEEVQAAVHYYF